MLDDHIAAAYSSMGWTSFFMTLDLFFLGLAMSGTIDHLLTGKKKKKNDTTANNSKSMEKISLADMAYWSTSVVGIIFSSIVTYRAWNCGWKNSYFTTYDLFAPSECGTETFQVFVGYILCDTFWAIYFCRQFPGSVAMIFHHLMSFTTFNDLIATDVGHSIGILVLLFEATTPFINLRYLLSKMNMKESILYKVNGIILTFGWLIFRIGIGSYAGYFLYQVKDQLWDAPAFTRWFSLIGTFISGYALQWIWGIKIAKGFYSAIFFTPKTTTGMKKSSSTNKKEEEVKKKRVN